MELKRLLVASLASQKMCILGIARASMMLKAQVLR